MADSTLPEPKPAFLPGARPESSALPPIPEGCGILPVAENRMASAPRAESRKDVCEPVPEPEYVPSDVPQPNLSVGDSGGDSGEMGESGGWQPDPRKLPVFNDALEQKYRRVLARALALTAAALLVAAVSALSIAGAPASGDFTFTGPLLLRVVFFSQVVLLGLLSRYVERLSMIPAAALLFSYAAFCGLEFAVLVAPLTLAAALLCGALMYGAAALWGYLRGCNLANPITPVIMILGGGLTLVVLNLALGTPKLAWSLSAVVVVLFGAVEGSHAQQVRDFYQDFDDDNAQGWKASVLGALLLVVNSMNLYLLAATFVGRFLEDEGGRRENPERF